MNDDEHAASFSSNDDLRELCLLLDEERYKMHQLAEQWKQFGTSTIHKLECQIIDYQEKLVELEQRQEFLLRENDSLKTIIDQFRKHSIKTVESTKKNISTQTNVDKLDRRINLIIDDPLQQQMSLQNMFDAIKVRKKAKIIEAFF